MSKALHISCVNCPHKGCLFCSSLSPESVEKLEREKTTIKYKKGQMVYFEGAIPNAVYCLYEGKVKVSKQTPDGKEQIIYLGKSGDIIGTKDLMTSRQYPTSACTLEDSVICAINKNIFLELINENPFLHGKINEHLCKILMQIEGKVINFSQRSVRERVAINILDLEENFGIRKNDEIVIDIPLSREDMASMVGTATETVIRILSEFKKEGMVNFSGKNLTITNITNLRKVASF